LNNWTAQVSLSFSIPLKEMANVRGVNAQDFSMTLEVRHSSAACLDASVAKRFASGDRVRPGKEMLARIVSMLTRLIDRFDEGIPRIKRKDSVQNT